ncbi:MAG: hypothetical protein ABWY04_14925 [Arthrobacter sp.]
MELIDAAALHRSTGDSRSLSRRYSRGELIRVRRGVYALKQEWISLAPWERYRQTVLAVNLELPESRFCLNTAAVLWDLELLDVPSHVHLSGSSRGHTGKNPPTTCAAVMPTGRTGIEGVTSYGTARHGPQTPAVPRAGLLVTPLPETVVSVIARENFAAGTVLADHAIGVRRTSGPPVGKDELFAHAARLKSGARRRWVTQVLDFAVTNSGSAGESLSRAQMHLLGFPAPLLQANFHIGGRFIARTDFFWPQFKLIGEFDGDAKYLRDEYLGEQTARQAVLAEKKREDKLRAAGFRVARWDWPIAADAPRLAALLRNAGLPRSGVRNKNTH